MLIALPQAYLLILLILVFSLPFYYIGHRFPKSVLWFDLSVSALMVGVPAILSLVFVAYNGAWAQFSAALSNLEGITTQNFLFVNVGMIFLAGIIYFRGYIVVIPK